MALANLLGRNKTLQEDTTFRFDSQRNLSRRDEEMFRLNGASIRQTKEVGRGTWAKRRDLGHCIWRLYGSRSRWDWNRTDKTSPSLFSTSFQISNDFSPVSIQPSRLSYWELCSLWILAAPLCQITPSSLSSSLLSMAFPSSTILPLVPIWLWCPCCCLPHWVPFPCRLIKLPQTLPINNQSFVKSPLLCPVSTEILEFLSHGSELTSVSWLLIHHDLISVPSKALPLRMPHFAPSIANNLSWPDLIVSFVFFFSGCYLLALE